MHPWFEADGRAVGCTAYWEPRYWPGRDDLRAIEIGFTWLAASAQGSGINAEAKLLLMDYAFAALGVGRVDLKTDARNLRPSARPSRECCAAIRCHGRQVKRAGCGTQRCTR
jgi:RimJ/RimL family protein N-acetyltransferase